MHVGVLAGSATPRMGGGYSVQMRVLRALLKFGARGRHRFTVLARARVPNRQWAELAAEAAKTDHVRFLDARLGFAALASARLRRVAQALARLAGNPDARFAKTDPLESYLLAGGFDFLWYLTPNFPAVDVPYLYTVWDLQHRFQPWFPELSAAGQWAAREKLYRTTIPRASALIAGTEAGKADIVRFYGVAPERVRVIPPFAPQAGELGQDGGRDVCAKYGIPGDYLFYPAQFWPHKNHVGLLRALRILRDKHNLVFPAVFAGADAGNRAHVERTAERLGLRDQAHFLGFVPDEDLATLYRRAFALVFVTLCGPDNLPPLEAFAAGCPVVASNVPGHQEQLGDGALFVDARDPEAIADAVAALHANADLRRGLVEKGRALAALRTPAAYIRAVLSILDEFETVRGTWPSAED